MGAWRNGAKSRRPLPRACGASVLALLCGGWIGCDHGELGDCSQAAARELVYGRNGAVATKGQALAHDSCGSRLFCHSSAAVGAQRYGAPAGMNFDMLPSPTGLGDILERADDSWSLVKSGDMPPRDTKNVVSNGDWSFDIERRPDAPRLSPLSSPEGKAAFRNWLACGAPTVAQTTVPAWAQPQGALAGDGGVADWTALYDKVFAPSCAYGGCHDATTAQGGLAMDGACKAHQALLGSANSGHVLVVPGDSKNSFLLDRLDPSCNCGGVMPPTGPLSDPVRGAIRAWIEAGAPAPECP